MVFGIYRCMNIKGQHSLLVYFLRQNTCLLVSYTLAASLRLSVLFTYPIKDLVFLSSSSLFYFLAPNFDAG